MPALLISTSRPPSAATASGTMRSISARWLMSQGLAARPGISLASASSDLVSISQTKTFAPVAAKARANSRPMPAAPAVIRTRWVMVFLFFFFGREIQRIAGGLAHLGRLLGLGVGDVLGIDGDDAGALLVRGHHHLVGLRLVHAEHGLE